MAFRLTNSNFHDFDIPIGRNNQRNENRFEEEEKMNSSNGSWWVGMSDDIEDLLLPDLRF